MKRLISILFAAILACALSLSALAAPDTVVDSGECGQNLTWELTEDGTLTISGEGEMMEAPWKESDHTISKIVVGDGVTTIFERAFCANNWLLEVYIGESVKHIEDNAFSGCQFLETVCFPEGLITIGNSAFQGCHNLSDAALPDSLTSIGRFAFYENALTEIHVSDNVTHLGVDAFLGCKATSLYIGTGLTQIPEAAFMWLTELESVTIPGNIKSIEKNAFGGCWNLKNVTFNCGLTEIGDGAFSMAVMEGVVLPMTVTRVGDSAFSECFNLTSVTMGDRITYLDDDAFYDCDKLAAISYTGTESQWNAITIEESDHLNTNDTPLRGIPVRYNSSVPAEGHNEIAIPGKSATCTESGLTSGEKCSLCGEILKAQDLIPAAGHVESIMTGKATTCTEAGLSEGANCIICGEITIVQSVIPATGHNEIVLEDRAPTCVASGLTGGIGCSVCGEVIKAQEGVPAMGHSEVSVAGKEPTCTEAGLTEGIVCSLCGEVTKAQETIPASSHKEVSVPAAAPTCTESGLSEGSQCSVCDEIIEAQKVIEASGHSWNDGEITKAPTYVSEGEKSFVCRNCGEARVEILPKLETAPIENPFADVVETDYFYAPVLWTAAANITTGTSATTFSPNTTCNRAQVVTFLWRANGCPEPTNGANPFVDVKESDYFYKAVLWAVEQGITTGVDANHFGSDRPCTRGQVATFLWRANGKPGHGVEENPFKDVSADSYFYDAILWAYESAITTGASANSFAPENSCTRGQIVTFLHRSMA